MENAAKALLIVGGVLLAILVICIAVFFRGNLSNVSESYIQKTDVKELQKYNTYFEVYIGRTDISVQEIVTLINLAKQKGYGTKVYIKNVDYVSKTDYDESSFLNNNILSKFAYSKIEYYTAENSETGMVSGIYFTKIK